MNRFQLFSAIATLASLSQPVCYEGDGTGGDGTGEGGAGAGAGAGSAGSGAGAGATKTFTQEDVNKFLAADKRAHRAQMEKLEAQLSTLTQNTQLSETERNELNASLEDVRKQLRTKEQQAALEKQTIEQTYKGKLTEAEKKAQEWEAKYTDSTIRRSLQDAAIAGDAFNPAQVTELLRTRTKMVGDQPMVDFEDRHAETGEQIITQMSPADAVKRMRDLPTVYGNLFKANIVSGIGGASKADGVGPGGKVDVSKLSPAQYRKMAKENPEQLYGNR